MTCKHCVDLDGQPCFPQYGLAPHAHTDKGIVFSTEPHPGFTPDEECPTHGTWWCTECGDGKPDEVKE